MRLKRGVLEMARSFPIVRPGDISSVGGELINIKNEELGRLRLPEAEVFENFLPSADEIRKRKLQDKMMLGNVQRDQQIAQLKALLGSPMQTMRQGDIPMFDAMEPESIVDIVNQFGFQGDTGVGLAPTMLNDFSGSGFRGGFSGLNMGGMFA